jgi:dTMP kinase
MVELRKGAFIAIEGVDGAGSTTQTRLLVESLIRQGYPAMATKEPNPEGKLEPVIRTLLRDERTVPTMDALLFAADRIDHVERVIKPLVASKMIVVTDRYFESSIAYQKAEGLDEKWIISINRNVIEPDLTIILDIDPGLSLKRKCMDPDRFENVTFLSKVRKNFLERAKIKGFLVIDAMKPSEEVQQEILRAALFIVKGLV